MHIGFLYDERRVKVVDQADHGSVNPNPGGKCDDDFRPAHSLDLKFPGGLDLRVAVLHLPPSPKHERYDARKLAWSRLSELGRTTREKDDDLHPRVVQHTQQGLSDHCPIVVELVDRDLD